jgi:LacI family transcriptional regulator
MATIKDVAKRAGVSPATISNVLNGTKYVSEDLCESVRKAIKELDYHPDFIASNMRKQKTQTIGVVVTTLNRIFVSQVINGIQSIASKNNYKLIFYSSDDSLDKEIKYVRMLVNNRVDGIIIDTLADKEKNAEYLKYLCDLKVKEKYIPVISIERNLVNFGIRSVHVNNVSGGEIATEHLITHGCKKIALITGPNFSDIVSDRYRGYRNMLEKYNIPYNSELVRRGDFTPVSGYQAAKYLFMEGVQFDGVFACNDEMAVGVLKVLKENNILVPDEVKIIGFDNAYVSSLVEPSISTVNVPKFRIGSSAAKMLIDTLSDNWDGELSCEMPINIMIRTSTETDVRSSWDLEYW